MEKVFRVSAVNLSYLSHLSLLTSALEKLAKIGLAYQDILVVISDHLKDFPDCHACKRMCEQRNN